MNVLVTFPGRYGDLLWALPTVRAISRRLGEPVHLQIGREFSGIVPLLVQQPYIATAFADQQWGMEHRVPPVYPGRLGHDTVIDLGYRGWPEPNVVQHTMETFNAWSRIDGSKWTKLGQIDAAELDLQTPWITLPEAQKIDPPFVIAFTEVHFELKVGLTMLMLEQFSRTHPDTLYRVITVPGSRWANELWPSWSSLKACTWLEYAQYVQLAGVVLADCSAAHVLAVAMGVKTVLMEPLEARWNPVFYPLGMDGPQVTVVKGNDGKPTFDARHTFDAVEAALRAAH